MNLNELTRDNSVLCLIDHQPWVAFPVQSISPERLTNNVTALAKTAAALEVPTILSTINGKGGPLRDPLLAPVQRVFPDIVPIDRHRGAVIASCGHWVAAEQPQALVDHLVGFLGDGT